MSDPTQAAHAEIGPSALARVLACPASVIASRRAIEADPTLAHKTSTYAEEGTRLHTLAETAVKTGSLPDRAANPDDYLAVKTYLDHIQYQRQHYARGWTAVERTEFRVDLAPIWDDNPPVPIFGTVDHFRYAPLASIGPVLCVNDFKGGVLPVPAQDNPQLLAYALGVYHWIVGQGRIPPQTIIMSIVQPVTLDGSEPIKTFQVHAVDLLIWGDMILKPGVELALDENKAFFTAGSHCRYCKAAAGCKTLRDKAQETAKTTFPNPPPPVEMLTNDMLAETLENAETLRIWLNAVIAEAARRADQGQTIPRHKLVPKRANRKWSDDGKALKDLFENADDPDRLVKTAPVSPAQAQKIDPVWYKNHGAQYVTKESSGTTLVPETDPREGVLPSSVTDFPD